MRPVAPQALSLLISMLETSGGRVVEDMLDAAGRDALHLLRDCGALAVAEDVPAVMCPACGDHGVAPWKMGGVLQGLCPACGYVEITNASLKAWAVDQAWLLGRLRMAFGIADRQESEELVAGVMWKLGDHMVGRRLRRIIFVRRLADHGIHKVFRNALTENIERDNAVIIGTTSRSAAMVSDISMPYIHLAEIVHLRSGKLERDEGRWNWCLKPAHLRGHDASPVFFDNFRIAVIDGEEYEFSALQAAVLAYLHAVKIGKCFKDSIMDEIGSPQKNPLELFRHKPHQFEGFSRVADWNEQGYYWLKRR